MQPVIAFPWAPRVLWPNGSRGVHWTRIKAARDKQKSDAALLMRGMAPVGDGERVTLTVTFCAPPRTSRYDLDNALASQKGTLDAIAAALGVDDSRFDLTLRKAPRAPGTAGGMIVTWRS